MNLIYHVVPFDEFYAIPTDRPYRPAAFDRDGFIHCTRSDEQLVVVANRYFRDDFRPLLVLVIDEDALTSRVKDEPGADGAMYPHIYGLLNRDAIISILRLPRLPDGSFQFPDRSQTRE
jgi:uncharacterized protein (DUF952 family)